MIFRFVAHRRGAHVHGGVWVSPAPGLTFAKAGEVTLLPQEWDALRSLLVVCGGGDVRPQRDDAIVIDVEWSVD